MAIIYLAHLLLPALALAWLAFSPLRDKRARALQTAGVGLFLAGAWLAGSWFYPPAWTRWVHAGLFVAAVWRAWRIPGGRSGALAWATSAPTSILLAAVGSIAAAQGITGHMRPAATFDLASPLDGGRFCVISGGAAPLLNFHMATLAPEFAGWRGQSFGADFVAVGPGGMRARSLAPQPADLDAYHIYGAALRAPCAGAVVAAQDGLSDQAIGARDEINLPGNHVVLSCSGHQVLLGHMQPGSVRVRAGEDVAIGDPLGAVGNSGNSDEPHLHISVQRAPPPDAPPQSGEPMHITFEGEFLARGDCLR